MPNQVLKQLAANKCFGGEQLQFNHPSSTLNCTMRFSIFLPSKAKKKKVPVLYWLSGLTCSDENFVHKAGAQQYAEQHGIAIVAPDTSPRGNDIPDDADGAYDFGLGAGFYVDATQAPWNKHYQMYSYISQELPALINANFPIKAKKAGIFGHSMGGHGALSIALKNPDNYKSVSAFAPIAAPMQCPWGEKALANYLGSKREHWKQYDSCELIRQAVKPLPMLIDQGTDDNFLAGQLKPELLEQAAAENSYPLVLRRQKGYDHSYFFMASFMAEHIAFHALYLK